MSKITNYTTLKAAVISAAEDNSDEFESYFDTALGIAEEEVIDDLNIVEAKKITTINSIASDNLLPKPEDYLASFDAINRGNINDATEVIEEPVLTFTTNDFLAQYWPDADETGVPKYYADYDEDNFVLAPTPSDTYEVELTYLPSVEPLTPSNQTNLLVRRAANALFSKVMEEMCLFQKAYQEADMWNRKYIDKIERITRRGVRQRRDDSFRQYVEMSTENDLT